MRAVFGPAGLLDITADARGNTSARSVLARGRGGGLPGAGDTNESEGEAARQRVVRRADALGWFLTENGRRVRFFVDTDDWPRVASGVSTRRSPPPASGWRRRRPRAWTRGRCGRIRGGRWRLLPIGVFGGVGVLRAGRAAARADGRRAARRGAAAGARARRRGRRGGAVRVRAGGRRARGRRLAALAVGALALAALARRGQAAAPVAPPPGPRWPVLLLALVVVVAGASLLPSLRVGTRQWGGAPMFFVSVRAELDEPVVLREIRRLTDELRDQPGVANAWSVADLFMGVTLEGDAASRIPDDPEQVRRILVQARTDPAVRLELAGDHREALIVVRFDDDPTIDHLSIVARLERYLALELRRALLRVDTAAPGVSPVTRSLGRGVLAIDARERVLRICARSGRPLDTTAALAVERVARQAATIPAADPARLEADVADNVRDFIARHPFALGPAEVIA